MRRCEKPRNYDLIRGNLWKWKQERNITSKKQTVNGAENLRNAADDEEVTEILLSMCAINEEPSTEKDDQEDNDMILLNKLQHGSVAHLEGNSDIL